MTVKTVKFKYEGTIEVEVEMTDLDWATKEKVDYQLEQAWVDYGPEAGDQSPGINHTLIYEPVCGGQYAPDVEHAWSRAMQQTKFPHDCCLRCGTCGVGEQLTSEERMTS